MACSLTLAGRGIACKDALGGIKRIYIGVWSDGLWADIASGEVAGLDGSNTLTVYTYDMTKGSGSLTQTVTSDIAAGTIFYDQALSVTFAKLSTADITELSNISKGRMAVMVEDNNGNWFVMGHKHGVEVSGGTVQTGTAVGDQNGFTLEFNAQEIAPAPFLALTSGAPTDTDITVTAAP
jgi:hypothetical protein|tara:strand:- start:2196 stop:2735 length:540 start_codon:yes stop_codon:yes gene_type:complete